MGMQKVVKYQIFTHIQIKRIQRKLFYLLIIISYLCLYVVNKDPTIKLLGYGLCFFGRARNFVFNKNQDCLFFLQ